MYIVIHIIHINILYRYKLKYHRTIFIGRHKKSPSMSLLCFPLGLFCVFSVLHQSVCFAARLGYFQISSISILTEEENLRRIVTIFTKLQKRSLKSDVKLWFAVFSYRELHVYLLQVAIKNIYNGIT